MTGRWSVVVPLKPPEVGKSRLRVPGVGRVDLNRAIAMDTIDAAHAASAVAEILVVSADDAWPLPSDVHLVREPGPTSIADAVARGVAVARAGTHRAVLLGDLPGLDPAELDAALRAAKRHRRAGVPDLEGTGTTLATFRAGIDVVPHFGPGSWRAHERAGHHRIELPPSSSLRRDVDEHAHLGGRLGPRTAALWAEACRADARRSAGRGTGVGLLG